MTATSLPSARRSNTASLSTLLREHTREAHERAEQSPFIADLLEGRRPISAYAELVAQNYAIYATLEELGDEWRGDPIAGPFVMDELRRLPHLEQDLKALLGGDWAARAEAAVRPATHAYAVHLEQVCSDWPAGFVAHHYVRYLGDLSGGQIIVRTISDLYGDEGVAASSFYRFEAIPKVKPFRDEYRRMLDALPLSPTEQLAVAAEAVHAFELNRAVFADLEH